MIFLCIIVLLAKIIKKEDNMPVILPPLAGYVALAQKRNCDTGGDGCSLDMYISRETRERVEKEFAAERAAELKRERPYWIVLMVLWYGFIGWAIWYAFVGPARERACARSDGAQKVLESLHSDAIRSANTANFSDYMVIPQSMLERDSVRYARQIQRIIRNSGYDYLYWDDGIQFDVHRCKENIRRQQCAYDYERAVKKLAVRRRTFKQK